MAFGHMGYRTLVTDNKRLHYLRLMKNILCTLLLAVFALAQTATAEKTDDQTLPHVLLIFADDLGYGDIGCYGATKLKTPHIDRLAEEGMRFTNAYVTSSTCSQSRYSLITGRLIMVHLGTTLQSLFNQEK